MEGRLEGRFRRPWRMEEGALPPAAGYGSSSSAYDEFSPGVALKV